MPGVSLKVIGLERVRRNFRAMGKRATNQQGGFWNFWGARAFRQVIKNFAEEKGPNGKWEDLADSTKAARRKGPRKRGFKILQDKGRLRASTRFKSFKDKALVFSNVKYADFHQHQHKKYKRPPKRQFMWVPSGFIKKMADRFAKFVVGGR